jgi:hypothetical protein
MKTIPGCPILQDTCQIQGLSNDLAKTIRKLRRDLKACQACHNYEDCTVLKEFNTMVQTAIEEVSSEWEITAAISR